MDVKIRRAKPGELKVIQDLNFELFQSDKDRDKFLNQAWPYGEGEKIFSKMLTTDTCIVLVAEVEDKVVGYLAGAIMGITDWRPVKRTELENMFVKEEFRSQGIGSMLVKEFLSWSREKGVTKALVVAYASNDQALNFYKKAGFFPESVSLEANI